MNISQVQIKNILGIKELTFDAGEFTEISGRNGEGKTSILEAIKAALSSGHDATLLRKGSEKGEVVLVLDDGTEISKTVTAAASNTTVKRDGKKQLRPAEIIRSMTDLMSVNPIDFLLAPKKDRARALLEAMPLEADTAYLTKISGVPISAQPGTHAMHIIDKVYATVYDDRTGTNRAIKEKENTVAQLRAAIPPAPKGVSGDESALNQQVADALNARDLLLTKITTKIGGIEKESMAEIDRIKTETQAQIDKLRDEAQEKINKARAALTERQTAAAAAKQKANTECDTVVTPLRQQLAIISNDREAAGRRTQTLDTISAMTSELETLNEEAERQNEALAAIEGYKLALLSKLPIPDIEIVNGEIMRSGVAFDRLNTAQQVEISVELAKLRAGSLGVICVDRIECLDSDTLAAFKKSAIDSGLQMFVTRVSDDKFSIN